MRHQLLLLTILLSCGLIASAQKEWDGLLTTVEHPTDPAQGRVLAIMTNDAYIPIQIKDGVYASVTDPLQLSGKPIQLDSIYHFVCNREGDSYNYDFEQLYKGAKYVTAEGWFVTALMGEDPNTGVVIPGIESFFLTKDKVRMDDAFTEWGGIVIALGGWTRKHLYDVNRDLTFTTPPDSIYTIRFVEIGRSYMATHVLSSKLTSIDLPTEKSLGPIIKLEDEKLFIKSTRPISFVEIYSPEGYASRYETDAREEIVIPLQYASHCSVVHIEFADGSTPFTQKILL